MADVEYVKARFGGEVQEMCIERGDLSAFEATAGTPAYVLFQHLKAGTWTIKQVSDVLTFALLSTGDLMMARRLAQTGMVVSVAPFHSRTGFVAGVLSTRPPARYATLAMMILGAALFGMDEAEAVFNEDGDGEK